jgi:hypothetical protein
VLAGFVARTTQGFKIVKFAASMAGLGLVKFVTRTTQ